MNKASLFIICAITGIGLTACTGQSWGQFWNTGSGTEAVPYSSLLSDTGQTLCYNAAGVQPCASISATYPGQDALYINVPMARSFTGPAQSSSFPSDYTTKDNVTGLVWKTCSEGPTDAGCTTPAISPLNWTGAATACNNLNTANSGSGYAGITSWRLPTIHEMRTISNYSLLAPAVDIAPFPATSSAGGYWSSDTYVPNTAMAWFVNSNDALIDAGTKTNSQVARCVSGTAYGVPSYVDNGDGTVTDQKNNLRWQKCSKGLTNDASCSGSTALANWQSALSYCQNLSLAGKTWRLPNMTELHSILNVSLNNPAINLGIFPATQNNNYWASTSDANSGVNAWCLSFDTGISAKFAKTVPQDVRCVAAGP